MMQSTDPSSWRLIRWVDRGFKSRFKSKVNNYSCWSRRRCSRRPTGSSSSSSTSCNTSSSCTGRSSTGSCAISGPSTSTGSRSSADSSHSRGGRCSACKCVISLCLYFFASFLFRFLSLAYTCSPFCNFY